MATKVEVHDRVKFLGNTSGGTGTLLVGSSIAGFRTPASTFAAQGHWWPFLLHDESNNEWEVGYYPEQQNANTSFDRSNGQIVLASSNGGSAVNFTNTASDSLTVSLVDPAKLVNVRNMFLDTSGLQPEIDAVIQGLGDTVPGYGFPLTQSPKGAVDAIFANLGTGHVERTIKRQLTFDDTPVVLATIAVPTDASGICVIKMTGTIAKADGSEAKVVSGVICADYNGTTSDLLGTPSFTTEAEDAGLAAATFSASMSLGNLDITVTGIAATSIEWAAHLEVMYTRT